MCSDVRQSAYRYTEVPTRTELHLSNLVMTSVRISVSRAGVLRERPSHATDLAQCCKSRSDGVDDLGPHGDASVDVDTKFPGCSDWRHQGITDTNRTSRDLVLTS